MKRLRKIPVGTVFGALVAAYIAFYLVSTVQHNYDLQRQIRDMQQQVVNLQTDNQTLKYQIQYYQTNDYKEKEARAKLGLQAPGEGVILLPHNSNASEVPQPTTPQPQPQPKLSDFQQWVNFLLGKAN